MRCLPFFLALLLLLAPFAPLRAAEPVRLTLVHVNDLDRIDQAQGRGGLARLAALLAAERAKGHRVIFTHGGDAISPSLLSAFDRGAHMIALLNRMQPDAMVLGNHEFDFGPEVLQQRVAEAQFPVFGANLQAEGRPVAGLAEVAMLEADGLRIGLAGVVTPRAMDSSQPGALTLAPMVPAAESALRDLQSRGADVTVLLVHGNRAEVGAIASAQPDWDVLLTGDDRALTLFYDGRQIVAQAAGQADYVPVIDLLLQRPAEEGQRPVLTPQFRVIDTATVEPDAEMGTRVEDAMKVLDAQLDAPIARTPIALDSRRSVLRNGDGSFGRLVAEAMRVAGQADCALMNGGGIRGDRQYPADSDITGRAIVEELPFGNRLTVVTVTGAQLAAALENGVAETGRGAGRFPQLAGIAAQVQRDAPAGQRVTQIVVAGAPLEPARQYRLATSSYLAAGGDGYTMLRNEEAAAPLPGPLLSTAVIDHLREHGVPAALPPALHIE